MPAFLRIELLFSDLDSKLQAAKGKYPDEIKEENLSFK
jgi:hypothetical protein